MLSSRTVVRSLGTHSKWKRSGGWRLVGLYKLWKGKKRMWKTLNHFIQTKGMGMGKGNKNRSSAFARLRRGWNYRRYRRKQRSWRRDTVKNERKRRRPKEKRKWACTTINRIEGVHATEQPRNTVPHFRFTLGHSHKMPYPLSDVGCSSHLSVFSQT